MNRVTEYGMTERERKKSEGQQAMLNRYYEEKRTSSSRVVSDHTGKEIVKYKPSEKWQCLTLCIY